MDLPRLGILACPSIAILASIARGQLWIGDGAQGPLMLLAALVGIFSFVAFTQRTRNASLEPAARHDDDAWPCHVCGYDVRHKPERCPECGTLVPPHRRPLDPRKLREEWPLTPIEPRVPAESETLVRAWDAPNPFAANLFVEQLRARGMRSVIRKRLPAMQVGEYVTPSADHAVFIFSGDLELFEATMAQLARDPVLAPPPLARKG